LIDVSTVNARATPKLVCRIDVLLRSSKAIGDVIATTTFREGVMN
jgi:hypothetical protein